MWALVAGLIGGLSVVIFLLSQPLSPHWRDGEYRRHLTKEEKARLAAGEAVDKTHHSRSFSEGSLRVQLGPDGKYVFTPYGTWRLTQKGVLVAEEDHSAVPGQPVSKLYNPDGSLGELMYEVPTILNGDSVREMRIVYLRLDNPRDTLVVQHFYSKTGKPVGGETWSFDTRGRHPVPPGWKFNRNP